jgi:hypothetical protein
MPIQNRKLGVSVFIPQASHARKPDFSRISQVETLVDESLLPWGAAGVPDEVRPPHTCNKRSLQNVH